MTYKDFINTLSRRMGTDTDNTESLSAAFVTAITQTLQAGKNVCLRGLGNLYVFKQLELITENPLTGQKTLQPPRLEVRFEPANPETDDVPQTNVGAGRVPARTDDAPETFAKQFFSLLAEGLRIDNYVNIKGLGTFKKIEGIVRYVPDASLRDTINKPFSQFEPVVLADGVDFSTLDAPQPDTPDADAVGAGRVPARTTDEPQSDNEPKPAEPTSDEGLPWGIIAPIFLAGLLIGGFLVWAIMTYWNQ